MDVPAAIGGGCEEKTTLFSYAAGESRQDARSLPHKKVKPRKGRGFVLEPPSNLRITLKFQDDPAGRFKRWKSLGCRFLI